MRIRTENFKSLHFFQRKRSDNSLLDILLLLLLLDISATVR